MCIFYNIFQVDFSETSIILTEPYFNFLSIQEGMNEILFEEYGFKSALRTNGESSTYLVAGKYVLTHIGLITFANYSH